MAKKNSAKKTPTQTAAATNKTGRRAIPTALIFRMVEEGVDALTIAKRVDRVNDGPDKTLSWKKRPLPI